jgi:hypothetical protein
MCLLGLGPAGTYQDHGFCCGRHIRRSLLSGWKLEHGRSFCLHRNKGDSGRFELNTGVSGVVTLKLLGWDVRRRDSATYQIPSSN